MMRDHHDRKRYLFDALYGVVHLPDFMWAVFSAPELQRLREVRLCNVNSLCLTGGANINRFEHALGTAYLAQRSLDAWPLLSPITMRDRQLLSLAALLHDVLNAAFGHSIEYLESSAGFAPERDFAHVVLQDGGEEYQYKAATLQPVFFGLQGDLRSRLTGDLKLSADDISLISTYITGGGRFGPLISGAMDLDNIDNVFRLGYHIGIVKSGRVARRLASSLWTEDHSLVVKESAVPLVKQWQRTRKRLYSLLLLNPEEFSAKCMLTEALERAQMGSPMAFSWCDTDYELLRKLSSVSSDVLAIVSRLMVGHLYGCIGVYEGATTQSQRVLEGMTRRVMEAELTDIIRREAPGRLRSAMLGLHGILDVDKTERRVLLRTDQGEELQIGSSSNRLLVGAFFKNMGLSMYDLDGMPEAVVVRLRERIAAYLRGALQDPSLRVVQMHGEAHGA